MYSFIRVTTLSLKHRRQHLEVCSTRLASRRCAAIYRLLVEPPKRHSHTKESLATVRSDALKALSPNDYQRILGELIWIALTQRPLLATLRVTVQPMAVNPDLARRLGVVEVQLLAQMAPLAVIRPVRTLAALVLATNASLWRGAVSWSIVAPAHAVGFLRRVRYVEGAQLPSAAATGFAAERKCRVALSCEWKRCAHINVKEASAICLRLRWE